MASPDGHRWALAVDALERCEAMGGGELHLYLLKSIALIDLFKERSGLVANEDALHLALSRYSETAIKDALEGLESWSLIIFRKFNNSYSIFEGSDFDIDDAVERVLATMPEVDFARLNEIADLQPIVARRHYHETGTMRWFDVDIVSLQDVRTAVTKYDPRNGAAGTFFLAIPTRSESANVASFDAQIAVQNAQNDGLIVGLPRGNCNVTSLAQELLAVEQVKSRVTTTAGG